MDKIDNTVEGIPQSHGQLGLVAFIVSTLLLAIFFLILYNVEFQGKSLLEIFTTPMMRYFNVNLEQAVFVRLLIMRIRHTYKK